jgi:ferrous iron transport protein B
MPANKVLVNEVLELKEDSLSHLKNIYGDDAEMMIADARYGFISGLLKDALKKPPVERVNISDKIDRVILNRWLGIPIFLALMYCVFQFVFTVSVPFMDWIDEFFGWLAGYAAAVQPAWLASLLADGIIGGLGSVLIFIPPIFLLFIAISILEDSGYMARAAFVMDRLMHKIGLHGRSFIPMILGFGCNIPGIMACRTIENPKDRLTTILVNPFMLCGARLPIFILLVGSFFSAYQGLVMFGMYLLGILVAIAAAFVFRKTLLKGESSHFVMELPPYRLPTISGVIIHMWERGKMFLVKAGTIIFAVVVVIWLLSSMPWGVEYASADSWIGHIGSFIAPVFAPAGFGQWQAGVSLIFGFLAKEVVVGTMGAIFGVEEGLLGGTIAAQMGWTPLIAMAFMVFCLLYVPCVAALGAVYGETKSWKWTCFTALYTTVIAWVLAVIVFQVGSLFV